MSLTDIAGPKYEPSKNTNLKYCVSLACKVMSGLCVMGTRGLTGYNLVAENMFLCRCVQAQSKLSVSKTKKKQ